MALSFRFAAKEDIPGALATATRGRCRSGAALWQESLVHNDQRAERRSRAQVLAGPRREPARADHRCAPDGNEEAVGRRSRSISRPYARPRTCTTSTWSHGCSDQASGGSSLNARRTPRGNGQSERSGSTRTMGLRAADRSMRNADSPRLGAQSIEACRSSTSSSCFEATCTSGD